MRSLLISEPHDVTLDELRTALARAGDEDERFEIKEGRARAQQILKAVAGLANRDGGVVVLGAERTGEGTWSLTGRQLSPDGELGLWLTQQIEDHLKPTPSFTVRLVEIAASLVAAVIWVEPHPDYLVVRSDGAVFRREHGSTQPVQDGRRLAELMRDRSAMRRPARFDLDATPDAIAARALALIDEGNAARLRASVTALRGRVVNAARFRPHDEFVIECDRLAAVTAALTQGDPDDPVTAFAIQCLQGAVDDAVGFPQIHGGRPDLSVYRHMRIRARALGGLLVRFSLWTHVRDLVSHQPPGDGRLYPGWLTYIAYKESEARAGSGLPDPWATAIREAATTAQRIDALRPDEPNANAVLESILAFDVLAGLLDLEAADRAGRDTRVETAFALFDSRPSRQIVRRVIGDSELRGALFPDRRLRDIARCVRKLDELARHSVASTRFWDGLLDGETFERVREMTEAAVSPGDVRG